MKKFIKTPLALLAAAALILSGASGAAAKPQLTFLSQVYVAATAKAAPAVTIKKIGNKTVSGTSKATIKPSYSKAKKVTVKSATLTVKKGKKTIAKNKSSVKLPIGTYKVTTTVKYSYKGKTSKASKTETVKVTKKKAPRKSSVTMNGKIKNCPAGYPVKGNRTGSQKDWIYHVKGGQFYNVTKPEECFRTTADARKAGYRASKR